MEMGRRGSTHTLLERDSWDLLPRGLLPRGRSREGSHCSDAMIVLQDIDWSFQVRLVMEPGVWSSIHSGKFPGKT